MLDYSTSKSGTLSFKCEIQYTCPLLRHISLQINILQKKMQMKEIYLNGYLPWKNHSTEPHNLFLPPFLFISDYLPGESTGETPTTEKPIEKKHLKEEKSKGVPPVKEVPQHHNLTSAPVRYFQCVFLNGPNGFGLQFPTNPPSNKEEKTHSKASKRKTRKPGQ